MCDVIGGYSVINAVGAHGVRPGLGCIKALPVLGARPADVTHTIISTVRPIPMLHS